MNLADMEILLFADSIMKQKNGFTGGTEMIIYLRNLKNIKILQM